MPRAIVSGDALLLLPAGRGFLLDRAELYVWDESAREVLEWAGLVGARGYPEPEPPAEGRASVGDPP